MQLSSRVQVPVGAPSEVLEIFDDISYCKGASIVRMLHNWIGDNVSVQLFCMYVYGDVNSVPPHIYRLS